MRLGIALLFVLTIVGATPSVASAQTNSITSDPTSTTAGTPPARFSWVTAKGSFTCALSYQATKIEATIGTYDAEGTFVPLPGKDVITISASGGSGNFQADTTWSGLTPGTAYVVKAVLFAKFLQNPPSAVATGYGTENTPP
jgi:hypothetical protein